LNTHKMRNLYKYLMFCNRVFASVYSVVILFRMFWSTPYYSGSMVINNTKRYLHAKNKHSYFYHSYSLQPSKNAKLDVKKNLPLYKYGLPLFTNNLMVTIHWKLISFLLVETHKSKRNSIQTRFLNTICTYLLTCFPAMYVMCWQCRFTRKYYNLTEVRNVSSIQ